MDGEGALYNGVELSAADPADGWLLDVRVGGVVTGRIRQHHVSGAFRYHRILESGAAPLHEANDLEAVLKWVAYRP